jgi:hypothetical protein
MRQTRNVRYFAIATVLTLFGMVAIFSVGTPFLLTGLVMIVVAPLRRRRALFWALLSCPTLFTLGYVTVAPLGCTSTSSTSFGGVTTQQASCSALVGEYHSVPSLLPAVVVGLLVAAVGATLIYLVISIRNRGMSPWLTIWVRSGFEVGYVATVAILAIVATADPIHKVRWAFIATILLCLPSLLPLLPVFYVVVSSAFNATGADRGGTTWPVTAAYVAVFTLAAITNALLVGALIKSREQRRDDRCRTPLHDQPARRTDR